MRFGASKVTLKWLLINESNNANPISERWTKIFSLWVKQQKRIKRLSLYYI